MAKQRIHNIKKVNIKKKEVDFGTFIWSNKDRETTEKYLELEEENGDKDRKFYKADAVIS